MADATPVNAVADVITAIDIDDVRIRPLAEHKVIWYQLRLTWQSGAITYREMTIGQADYVACRDAFLQAGWRKKLLQYLVTAGYETNITPV